MSSANSIASDSGGVAPVEWKENTPGRASIRSLPALLFAERELTYHLAWRSILARTKQSFFGLFWPVTQPIIGAAIYFLIFNRLAGISSGDVPYPLFAFAGATMWTYMRTAVAGGTSSIVMNAGVVKRTYIPRIVIPSAECLSALLGLVMSTGAVFVLLIVFRRPPTPALLTLPVWMVLALTLAFGMSTLLSVLNAKSRDVGFVLGYFLQAWQYASPVGYPPSIVPEKWLPLYYLNPLAGILDGFRWAVLGSELSPFVPLSVVTTVLVLVAGLANFARLERTIADYL